MNDSQDTEQPKKFGSLPGGRDVDEFVYEPAYAHSCSSGGSDPLGPQPPQDTKFKPGASGNPTGRPLGSKNKPKILNNTLLTKMMLEEYSRSVKVRDGNEVEHIPIILAIIRRRLNAAVAGDERAQVWAISAVREVEAANAKRLEVDFVHAEKYKKSFDNVRFGGLSGGSHLKCPIPNPNHIILNHRDRTVEFTGPRNVKEHMDWLKDYDRRMEELETQAHDEQFETKIDGDLTPSSDTGGVDDEPVAKKDTPAGEIRDAPSASDHNTLHNDATKEDELHAADTSSSEVPPLEAAARVGASEQDKLKAADETSTMMPPIDIYGADRIRPPIH